MVDPEMTYDALQARAQAGDAMAQLYLTAVSMVAAAMDWAPRDAHAMVRDRLTEARRTEWHVEHVEPPPGPPPRLARPKSIT